MIQEIVLLITGTIAFFIGWEIQEKLKEEKVYSERDILIYPQFYRLGIIVMLYALISPWAYFKPQKVKEGWAMLVISFVLFVLGLILVAKAISGI